MLLKLITLAYDPEIGGSLSEMSGIEQHRDRQGAASPHAARFFVT